MITAFIFTKNRAAQLRLLLESLRDNFDGVIQPYILYKATNIDFGRGYLKLAHEVQNWFPLPAVWELETKSIKEEFQEALEYADECRDLFSIFTDDCICYHKSPPNIDCAIENAFKTYPNLISFSLRLGRNCIIQNHRTGETHKQIDGIPSQCDNYIMWNAKRYHHHSNPGYIYGQDGCVFRPKDLLHELSHFERLDSFRAFEGKLSEPSRQNLPKGKTLMMAPMKSLVVNFPMNAVQEDAVGTQPLRVYSPEELNNKYLNNEVIDLRSFDFANVRGCHQEFSFGFKKVENDGF